MVDVHQPFAISQRTLFGIVFALHDDSFFECPTTHIPCFLNNYPLSTLSGITN